VSRRKVDLQAEPLLTAAEVAALFNVHALTVTRWAHAGARASAPSGTHRAAAGRGQQLRHRVPRAGLRQAVPHRALPSTSLNEVQVSTQLRLIE
jgi:hypothetical protein